MDNFRPVCNTCNENLEGDGYTTVERCPYADEDEWQYNAPDDGPVYCTMEDE